MPSAILDKISEYATVAGAVTWGIYGLTAVMGTTPPTNLVEMLLGAVGAGSFVNYVYIAVGAAGLFTLFKALK